MIGARARMPDASLYLWGGRARVKMPGIVRPLAARAHAVLAQRTRLAATSSRALWANDRRSDMDGFQKTLVAAAALLLVIVVVAFFWPGILFYVALALAILFFPLIIAMCSGFGITSSGQP